MSCNVRAVSGSGVWLAVVLVASAAVMPVAAQERIPSLTVKSGGGVTYVKEVDREDITDLGEQAQVATADIAKGLFPEDAETPERRRDRERCERLLAAELKCMPPDRSYTRFSLPGVSFSVGSADLPELMKLQLRSFAEVLRGRQGNGPQVRIDGHADASGNEDTNRHLSQRRAESVRDYLASLGVNRGLLAVKGFGSQQLRNNTAPTAAENRRVEIARNLPQ